MTIDPGAVLAVAPEQAEQITQLEQEVSQLRTAFDAARLSSDAE